MSLGLSVRIRKDGLIAWPHVFVLRAYMVSALSPISIDVGPIAGNLGNSWDDYKKLTED